jgi:PilZ domain
MATPPAKLEFPIEVIASDVYGQQFFENAQTLTVYPNGVSILLANKLAPDSEIIVRNPEMKVETLASVLGQLRKDASGQVYALAFVKPARELWRVPIADAGPATTLTLECSTCHSISAVSLSGIEVEMFEAARELARACEKCKSSRTWRPTTREHSDPPSNRVETPQAPAAAATTEPAKEDRRKTRRMAMKASACIRYAGVEAVVTCEDVSKGGFRFISRKEFPEGTRLEGSVPYTPFGNNIFLPACIVYCRELPDGQFRHGVAYIKTSGSIGWDSLDIIR